MAQEQKRFFKPFLKNKVPTLLSDPPLSSFKKLIVSLQYQYKAYIRCLLQRLFPKASRTGSAKGLLCKNVLWYPTCQKNSPSKKRFPLSRVTRVSKLPLG
jgi:hypothetical protein